VESTTTHQNPYTVAFFFFVPPRLCVKFLPKMDMPFPIRNKPVLKNRLVTVADEEIILKESVKVSAELWQ